MLQYGDGEMDGITLSFTKRQIDREKGPSAFYSVKLPCLKFYQTALPAVSDAAASPPFFALLVKIYFSELHQI